MTGSERAVVSLTFASLAVLGCSNGDKADDSKKGKRWENAIAEMDKATLARPEFAKVEQANRERILRLDKQKELLRKVKTDADAEAALAQVDKTIIQHVQMRALSIGSEQDREDLLYLPEKDKGMQEAVDAMKLLKIAGAFEASTFLDFRTP
jgi:hypothetical protein